MYKHTGPRCWWFGSFSFVHERLKHVFHNFLKTFSMFQLKVIRETKSEWKWFGVWVDTNWESQKLNIYFGHSKANARTQNISFFRFIILVDFCFFFCFSFFSRFYGHLTSGLNCVATQLTVDFNAVVTWDSWTLSVVHFDQFSLVRWNGRSLSTVSNVCYAD